MNPAYHTSSESSVIEYLSEAFQHSRLDVAHRLVACPKYVRSQDVAGILCRYEIFQLALRAPGSGVECGVFGGAGLMVWYHLSSILEPYNQRRHRYAREAAGRTDCNR